MKDHDAYFIPQVKLGTLGSLLVCAQSPGCGQIFGRPVTSSCKARTTVNPYAALVQRPFCVDRTRHFGIQTPWKPETHEAISARPSKVTIGSSGEEALNLVAYFRGEYLSSELVCLLRAVSTSCESWIVSPVSTMSGVRWGVLKHDWT
jgi:hypothetical protein